MVRFFCISLWKAKTIAVGFRTKRGWDKSPSLSIIFGLSSKTQWLSGLYYADFISFYSPTQLCGGGTTKSNSNELPISVPLSSFSLYLHNLTIAPRGNPKDDQVGDKKDSTDAEGHDEDLATIDDTEHFKNKADHMVGKGQVDKGKDKGKR